EAHVMTCSAAKFNVPTVKSPSSRFVEQLAADQHAADFAGTGADLVQLGVAPQAACGKFVDIPVAAQDLYAFAGHPGRLLGAIQDHGGAVLAHLANVSGAQLVQVLAHRIAERAAGLQGRVQVGDLALDQLEFTDRLTELLAVVDIR